MKNILAMTALLAAGYFDNVGTILESFLNQWWGTMLKVLAAAAAILGFAAGIKYIVAAKEGDEQKIKQSKNFIKAIFIGIIAVFLIAVIVPVLIANFQTWQDTVNV